MPIVESNSGNGFKGAISYSMQLEKLAELDKEEAPVFIECNGVYGSYAAMAHQMRWVAETQDFKKPVLHFRVNFSPSESQHLPVEKQVAAVKSILRGLGIDANRQYIISQHNDKEHTHYHIIANKVDLDGEKMDISNFNYRATAQADRVEREMGLELTANRTIFYSAETGTGFRYATAEEKVGMHLGNHLHPDRREGVQEMKEFLSAVIQQVLADPKMVDADIFQKELGKQGIEVRFMTNKNGISGASFNNDGVSVKGSHLGLKWGVIAVKFDVNLQTLRVADREKEQQTAAVKKEIHNYILEKLADSLDIDSFVVGLQNRGITYDGKQGFIYEVKDGAKQALTGDTVILSFAELGMDHIQIMAQLSSRKALAAAEEIRQRSALAYADKAACLERASAAWGRNQTFYEKLLSGVSAGKTAGEIGSLMSNDLQRFTLHTDRNGKLELQWQHRKNTYEVFRTVKTIDLRDCGLELVFNQRLYNQLDQVSFTDYNNRLQNQNDLQGSISGYVSKALGKAQYDLGIFQELYGKDWERRTPERAKLQRAADLFTEKGFKVVEQEGSASRSGWKHSKVIWTYQKVLDTLQELLQDFYELIRKWVEVQGMQEKKTSFLQNSSKKKDIAAYNEKLRAEKSAMQLPDVKSLEKAMADEMRKTATLQKLFVSPQDYDQWKERMALKASTVQTADKILCKAVGEKISLALKQSETRKQQDKNTSRGKGRSMG